MRTRTTARAVGSLFIIATAAGVLSVALPGSKATSGLLVLIMAAAMAMIPPLIFPVLRQHSEQLALGYVVARTVEVVLVLPAAVVPLTGVDLAYDTWGYPLSSIFFCLGALLLNSALFGSLAVPRPISGWALIAVLPYTADALLVMYGELNLSSPLHAALIAPLMVNEMVLAVWLLAKGFTAAERPPARSAAVQ
ncbi:DUF4386 family protein [Nonomuraea sp. NPDC050556]|uniref:DUF4386 family protein n=1 Tax=Nonomuraea sp. NPDC050556 TaxID=3364369 RepID=UPI00379E9E32